MSGPARPSGGGRRTPSRGSRPAGRGGPGRGTRPTRSRSADSGSRSPAARPVVEARPRPRFTSRAAVLVVIVAVLAVSYSSLMRAYLQQRDHLTDVQARIDASEASIDSMQDEIERQQTWAFVEQQARALGYVNPGERPFVVLEDGEPLDVEASLNDPSQIDPAEPVAWWDDAWTTMEVAGDPPRRTDPLPATEITDPEGAPTDGPEAEPDSGD